MRNQALWALAADMVKQEEEFAQARAQGLSLEEIREMQSDNINSTTAGTGSGGSRSGMVSDQGMDEETLAEMVAAAQAAYATEAPITTWTDAAKKGHLPMSETANASNPFARSTTFSQPTSMTMKDRIDVLPE